MGGGICQLDCSLLRVNHHAPTRKSGGWCGAMLLPQACWRSASMWAGKAPMGSQQKNHQALVRLTIAAGNSNDEISFPARGSQTATMGCRRWPPPPPPSIPRRANVPAHLCRVVRGRPGGPVGWLQRRRLRGSVGREHRGPRGRVRCGHVARFVRWVMRRFDRWRGIRFHRRRRRRGHQVKHHRKARDHHDEY